MNQNHNNISISLLFKYFHISRQACYQHEWFLSKEVFEHGLLLEEVKSVRSRHHRIGVRKLQVMLAPFIETHSIKTGRDGLFDLLSEHGLLVRKRKRHVIRTTQTWGLLII